jgi:uncharacterized repeat protein (TIGR03803 family)
MKYTLLLTIITSLYNLNAQTAELWSLSYEGEYNSGSILKTDLKEQTQNIEYSFIKYQGGRDKSKLLEADNGKLYGVTTRGGKYEEGVLFEYDILTKLYTVKVHFNDSIGYESSGALIQGNNGKIYGVTMRGGKYRNGVLFEYDITMNSYIVKIDFNSGENGAQPRESLLEASNGKLYGLSWFGGTYDNGVLFEYDIDKNEYTKKIDFEEGKRPIGSLIEVSDGILYGLISGGDPHSSVKKENIFEYDILTSSFVIKHSFSRVTGIIPTSIIKGRNGKLYGLTRSGGSDDHGVLFEFNPLTNQYVKKIDFKSEKCRYPIGELIEGKSGKFYGLTNYRGERDYKEGIFEFDLSKNTMIEIFNFKKCRPKGGLIKAKNGKYYGVTYGGGDYDDGILFEYDNLSDSVSIKINFDDSWPLDIMANSLFFTESKKMLVLTNPGSRYSLGGLFQYNPIEKGLIKKNDFNLRIGYCPVGNLIQATTGSIYGVMNRGGKYDKGTLYEYDENKNIFKKIFDFGGDKGEYTRNGVIEGLNGKLYGTTTKGGEFDKGTLFEYNLSTGIFSKKLDFNGKIIESEYIGELVQHTNGKLYGFSSQGGNYGYGILFEYDPITSVFLTKIHFDGKINGSFPNSLLLASNGKFYGLTNKGGRHGSGVLFEYKPKHNKLSKKISFKHSINGVYPNNLLQASNGKLYGSTYNGGKYDKGVLFEYDINKRKYKKVFDYKKYESDIFNLIEINLE